MSMCQERTSQRLRIRNCLLNFLTLRAEATFSRYELARDHTAKNVASARRVRIFLNQIPDDFKLTPESQHETPLVKEQIFFPCFHEKMLNLAERRKKRCVKIERKIGAAGSFCMDQSYFRFLFLLARNPNPNLDCPNPKKVWLKGVQPY